MINEAERIIALHREKDILTGSMISERIRKDEKIFYGGGELSLRDAVERLERRMIKNALESCRGNRTRSARHLGISRQGLLNKIKRYELENSHGS
ncbi:MAG: hypothetical protein GF417_02095 [Candidatus Latescibacteria bacterium]|nr:hypothetical protein [bacterium]MBD3423220.1 hypothetical protein [Candidatus Latescibacterota bacterium]